MCGAMNLISVRFYTAKGVQELWECKRSSHSFSLPSTLSLCAKHFLGLKDALCKHANSTVSSLIQVNY